MKGPLSKLFLLLALPVSMALGDNLPSSQEPKKNRGIDFITSTKLKKDIPKPDYNIRPIDQGTAPIFEDRLRYNLENPLSAYTSSPFLRDSKNFSDNLSLSLESATIRSIEQTATWLALDPIEQGFLNLPFIDRFDEKIRNALSPEVEKGQLVNPLDQVGEGRRRLDEFNPGTKADWGFEPLSKEPYLFFRFNDREDIGVLDVRVRAFNITRPSTYNSLPKTTAIFHKPLPNNWSLGLGYSFNNNGDSNNAGTLVIDRKVGSSYFDIRISSGNRDPFRIESSFSLIKW